MMQRITTVFVVLTSIAPAVARGQVSADQVLAASELAKAKGGVAPSTFGGELGLGSIGDDIILTLGLRLNINRDMWGLGVQVPLRLVVHDADPKSDDHLGFIRKEDWDEISDFAKIIRYVYVGQADKKGPFYVRLGELSGLTIGHGTIVHRFFNGFDVDKWRVGTNVAVTIGPYGGEAVIADLGGIDDPILAGGRITVRPLQIAMASTSTTGEDDGGGDIWSRLVVGFSVMSDPVAPYTVKRDPNSVEPERDGKRGLVIIGGDVGLEVLRGPPFRIEPYIDLNHINHLNAWGLHMGILWGFNFPVLIDDLIIDLRTEYRRVSGDYAGPYFDTGYVVDRFGTSDKTKLQILDEMGDKPGKNGVFFDLIAGLPSFVYVGGEYIDYDGGQNDGTLRLMLHVPALEFIQLSAFYYRWGISGLDDLFKIDNRSAIVAEAKIPVYWVFTVNLRWLRMWEWDGDNYEPVNSFSGGVGFSVEL